MKDIIVETLVMNDVTACVEVFEKYGIKTSVNKDNKIMEKLPRPGEGTLTHRMLPIKENLRAKTGTLSDISSIAGYLTSKSGKKYTFCIMTNDMKLSESDKKMLEDFIIREAYLRL